MRRRSSNRLARLTHPPATQLPAPSVRRPPPKVAASKSVRPPPSPASLGRKCKVASGAARASLPKAAPYKLGPTVATKSPFYSGPFGPMETSPGAGPFPPTNLHNSNAARPDFLIIGFRSDCSGGGDRGPWLALRGLPVGREGSRRGWGQPGALAGNGARYLSARICLRDLRHFFRLESSVRPSLGPAS